MISTCLWTLVALFARHTPHAEASGVAVAVRQDGRTEVVLASRAETRVLHSFDAGQSWQLVTGDGLERSSPTRVVYYPEGGSRFLIATREGIWCYWNELGQVQKMSAGIPQADQFLIDLIAPDPGSDGPALALSNTGKVFAFRPQSNQWQQVLDTGHFGAIGALAMTPDFDFYANQSAQRTIYVGHGRRLYRSVDAGVNWTSRADLVADPGGNFQFSAIELARDYARSGVLLVGLGRNSQTYTGTQGRLLRSADFGQQYQTIVLEGLDPSSAEITRILAAPPAPDGIQRFFLSLHYFAEIEHFPADPGILISADQGLTWSDFGNRQDFIEDGSGNVGTGVGRTNLWMTDLAFGPEFSLNGQLWLARGEGVYRSNDVGLHWTRRQIRPTIQVRGISAGLTASGQTLVAASTYGSSIVHYNPATAQIQLDVDSGILYAEPSSSSPNFALDGSFVVGGRNDVSIGLQTPPGVGQQRWFSVNLWRQALDGSTGYVREIALSPQFSPLPSPGTDRSFIWAANLPQTPIGDSRITFDGLRHVYPLHELANPWGDPAPRMFDLEFASSYVEGNLPAVLDVFGCSKPLEAIYYLANFGTASAADLKWMNLAFVPGGPVSSLALDPDFARPNLARVWALIDGNSIVRLQDQTNDWSVVQELRLPPLTDLEVTDFKLIAGPPDQPTIYALSYGEGVFKLDMSQQPWQWLPVGMNYPTIAASSMALDPNFAQTGRIFVGTHEGIIQGVDQPGVAWQLIAQPALHDESNQGFDFFSPLDPLNPDATRPWGWNRLPKLSLPSVQIIGKFIAYSQTDGAYARFDLEAKRFDILTLQGPNMADCRIEVFDYRTGVMIKSVQQGLLNPQLQNRRINLSLAQKRRLEVRVYAEIDQPGETLYFDGVRVLD
jgi:hypothetical protein